jgi:adenosylcobinamide-GDP ribazoletransferase
MKKELRIFFTAVMFLTRLPVPKTTDHSAGYLREAPRYFPVVGWIVGGCCSLVFWLADRYLSQDIAVVASMVTGLLTTGCFHEDGFADVCDGFGGGWTKDKILIIMKDSRIGAYGAIGLVMILGSKFLLLKELPVFIPAVIAAHSVSRLMPVLLMKTGVYAADPDQSKAKPLAGRSLSTSSLVLALMFALPPFLLLPWYFLVLLVPALLTTVIMYRWFSKWIGGYTGDCLGAVQQVVEIGFYLGCILLWRYL